MATGLAPSFGQLLRQHRHHAGLSQERLAEAAGLSVNQISDLERDRRARPHLDTLRRLADALGLGERDRLAFIDLGRPGRPATPAATAAPLPLPLTRFFARPDDLAAVRRRLAGARLLTLTGAGGVGKTRLAYELAHAAAGDYPDGVWLVELAGLQEPGLVPHTVARALGVPEQRDRPAIEALQLALHDRHLLLVVDNCEHLIDACAQLCDALLRYCPDVRILATSRERLRIDGEQVWPVQPLAVPSPRQGLGVAALADYPAVQLFADRANAVRPDFALTERNAATVVAICHLLDGLPLSIELAAAPVATLPLGAIAADLHRSFRLLTEGSRAAAPRHQTQRASIEWGFGLLSADEQTLLLRLSVFAGGWTVAAAEGVAAGDGLPAGAVLPLLARLAATSQVRVEGTGEQTRYRFLELIRQFAAEKLAATGTAATWQQRHADYFLALAEEAAPALATGERSDRLLQLEEEHDNLRAALRWLIAQRASEAAVRLAGVLGEFWQVRRYFREGRQWLEEALTLGPEAPDAVRARALEWLGVLNWHQGDYAAARATLEASLDLFERLGDRRSYTVVLRNLGMIALNQDEPDYERAHALFAECLRLRQVLGFHHGIASSLNDLALVALERGEYGQARVYLEDGLERARALRAERMLVTFLVNIGIVTLLNGETEESTGFFADALRRFVFPEDGPVFTYALAGLAVLASRAGRPELAARLAGASEGICTTINFAMPGAHRARFDGQIELTRAQLGAAAWLTAWAAGHSLTIEQALDLAVIEHQ